ncbi:MAG: class I SAM-dependent methyltransferase [Cellvibrionales bacterium]|nr:class I SAM-dependent methyltransferase [Porticoccaceae bacterium]|tara:strand:- start:318 stop:932 length:615 start_codon:yes stop_codon:yes gene_type:complete
MNPMHGINHHGITLLRAADPRVRRIRRSLPKASAHGNKIWRSSLAIMDYFIDNPLPASSRVLDIGCGWGAVAVHLAKHFDADVTALDIDPRVELLVKLHSDINNCRVNFSARDLATLDSREINSYHTIVGADICFWDAIVEPLFNLISRSNGPKPPAVLIADPGRPPFWELAERCVEAFDAEVISRNSYIPRRAQTFFLRIENE